MIKSLRFEWDPAKDAANKRKHGVSFEQAKQAFYDQQRIMAEDVHHSQNEGRLFCYGRTQNGILTVRFTMRGDVVRIFGAAYWREGRKIYAEKNNL
ncbi:MAG: BrnT family toxin [Alphaproteobacteria bacterium]|nr:BrnT family toxin [Alphaproteobacteria bacterium]